MLQFKWSRILMVICAAGLMAASAQAHEFSLVGALDWHKYDLGSIPAGTTRSQDVGMGYGGGALIDFYLAHNFSIEPGFLYLQQKFKDTSATPNQEEKTKEFQVPVVLKYWFSRMVSIGVGGYYSFATGDVTQSVSGSPDATIPYAGYFKKNDYGLIGSLGLHLPLGPMTHFLVDGRYLYGLKDVNDGFYGGGVTMKNREYQALVGFSFGFGR